MQRRTPTTPLTRCRRELDKTHKQHQWMISLSKPDSFQIDAVIVYKTAFLFNSKTLPTQRGNNKHQNVRKLWAVCKTYDKSKRNIRTLSGIVTLDSREKAKDVLIDINSLKPTNIVEKLDLKILKDLWKEIDYLSYSRKELQRGKPTQRLYTELLGDPTAKKLRSEGWESKNTAALLLAKKKYWDIGHIDF